MPASAFAPGPLGVGVLAAVLLLAVGGSARAAPTDPARAASNPIEAYLAPDLAASERAYFRNQLRLLPIPKEWVASGMAPSAVSIAVIDATTGVVHYNRPQDSGTWRQTSPTMPVAATPAGDALRGGAFDPGVTSDTGPYRRVYLQVPGLSKADRTDPSLRGILGTVNFPCNDGSHRKGDEAHIYLGGWSPTRTGAAANIDAGLMYNNRQRDASSDDYTLFMNLAGWTQGEGPKGSYWFKDAAPGDAGGKYAGHIRCRQAPIQLLFGVIDLYGASCKLTDPTCSRPYLVLAVFAPGVLRTPLQAVIWAPDYLSDVGTFQGGWGELIKDQFGDYQAISPCSGCVFKFMTSIAQKPPGNYRDMSTYSATWSGRSITCQLLDACGKDQKNPFIPLPAALLHCSEYPLWGPYQNGPRDCRDMPGSLKGIARSVGVSGYSASGEKDDIRLIY